jgi:serine/threonine protein kinase
MEYLAAGDLGQRLKADTMPLATVAALFADICSAVHYAHTFEYQDGARRLRGVIHRDLKPQNICFDQRGRLVVVDFGLARLLEDPSSSRRISGSPPYMAPEQWSPERGIDDRTDIYALGVILFEMVTRRLPFTGATVEDLMHAHLFAAPPDAREQRPGLPKTVADAIHKALQKNKEERFASVEEFSHVVAAGLSNLPVESVAPIPSPNGMPGMPTTTFQAAEHRRRGDRLAERGEYDRAIAEYDEAVRLDPHEVLALINRGYCLYRKRLFAEAIADYERALAQDPTNAEAYNNRGMVWKDLGQFAKAIPEFEQALHFDPTHPLAPNNLRDALERMKKTT